MEQKQKSKQSTIEDQIDELWKNNPKIPFMQSKEILAFGYTEGRKSINDKTQTAVQPMEESIKDEPFTCTTKEFFEQVEKETTKRQLGDNKDKKKTVCEETELKIEEARFKLLDELDDFIANKCDLLDIYDKVRHMRSASQQRLKDLQLKKLYD